MIKKTIIAIIFLFIGILFGLVLVMPSLMAFDSPNPLLSVKFAGYSGGSVIPVSIVATTVTILTQNLKYLLLNLLPIGGIATGYLIDKIAKK